MVDCTTNLALSQVSFPIAVGKTSRTMPERIADVYNVLDWNLVANGITANDSAMSTLIAAVVAAGGGTIFFPPGNYHFVSAINGGGSNDVGVLFIGSGKTCTIIDTSIAFNSGTYDIIERIYGLSVTFIKLSRTGASCELCQTHCDGPSSNGYTTSGKNNLVLNCLCGPNSNFPPEHNPHGVPVGSIGYAIGGEACTAYGCSATNCDIGYALDGYGAAVIGSRAEVDNIGVRVGWSAASAESPCYGAVITGLQTERTNSSIELYNCTGGFIAANILTGGAGTPGPTLGPITSITWLGGGVAQVTTTGAHNLPVGTTILVFSNNLNPTGWCPTATGFGGDQTFQILATRTGTNTFTYTGVASDPGSFTFAEWNYPLQYGIRCRKVYETTIIGIALQLAVSEALIDLDFDTANAEHRNNILSGVLAYPNGGFFPAAGKNQAGWLITNCEGGPAAYSGSVANVVGHMVFANLPGQSGVIQPGPIETQEYDIIDGSKSGFTPPTVAGFADTVIGGGNGHYKVRRDASNWTRVG